MRYAPHIQRVRNDVPRGIRDLTPAQYKALREKHRMTYRHYPTWKERKRRQTIDLWCILAGCVIATVAIILAASRWLG